MSLGAVLRLLRPKQWAKNLLVFAAYIFAVKFGDPDATRNVLIAFGAMCLISSATYIVNDIADAERDREHPDKKDRPIASGQVPVALAWGLAAVLLAAGLAPVIALFSRSSVVLVGIYLALQVLYNVWLKSVPVADVFTVSLGFIVRAWFGAAAIWVPVSSWLLFCTGALALMLGFAKRRHEFLLQGENRSASRESLDGYNKPALDALVIISATLAAICYGIYAIDSDTSHKYPGLIMTTLFVAYGIARYVLLVFSRDEGGEPADVLFGDTHILCSVLLFLAAAVLAVSGFQLPLIAR